VQRLVDPAVVVVAVVVPALGAQRFEVVGKRGGHDAIHGVLMILTVGSVWFQFQ